jgi:aspartyl-tRNA(Asn)/glutamyl-tRNA(Gln) amidotransferase subunit C
MVLKIRVYCRRELLHLRALNRSGLFLCFEQGDTMSLTIDDVRRVANLARLEFNESELAEITSQLSKVVTLVDELAMANTDGVDPMVHAIELANILAADIPKASLSRAEAIRNAPSADDECFRVPAVLG